MMNAGSPTKVKLLIARAGQSVVVREASLDSGTVEDSDPLNNDPSGTENWTKKGESLCYRWYPSDNDQDEDGTGEYDEDRPRLAFPPNTVASDGNRVEYGTVIYELTNKTDHGHYVSWSGREVDE